MREEEEAAWVSPHAHLIKEATVEDCGETHFIPVENGDKGLVGDTGQRFLSP